MPPIKNLYIGTDDFTYPAIGGVIFHGTWTILLGVVFHRDWHRHFGQKLAKSTLALFLASALCCLLNMLLAFFSSRGAPFQLSKRKAVVPLLLPVGLSLLFQIGSNAAATRLVYLGEGSAALKAVCIALWITTFFLLINIYLSLKRYGSVASAHERWYKRMKHASKVMRCVSAEAEEDAEDGGQWLLRLAEIFAAVMRFDLSTSDIFFGVILTSTRQAMDRRAKGASAEKSGPVVPTRSESGLPADPQPDAKDSPAAAAEEADGAESGQAPPKALLEEALYYLPFASSVYGVPMLLWLELRMGSGLCGGLFKFLCCCVFRVKGEDAPSDSAMLLRSASSASTSVSKVRVTWRKRAISLVAQVPARHVLYQNLDNHALGKLPFAVILDTKRRALVVAIRGTMSGSDVATDLVCDAAPVTKAFDRDLCVKVLGREPDDHLDYGHYGMLKAAAHVVRELVSLGLVGGAFGSVVGPEKKLQLIVCGHSLGAGAAGLVGLFMSAYVPDLRVWAFEPPGALVSPSLYEVTKRFTTCLVNNEDIICRLSVANVNNICEDVVDSLAMCRVSKARMVLWHWLPFSKPWSRRDREQVFFASEDECPAECRQLRDRMLAGEDEQPESLNKYTVSDIPVQKEGDKGTGFHRLVAPPLLMPGPCLWLKPLPTLQRNRTIFDVFKRRSVQPAKGGSSSNAKGREWAARMMEPKFFSDEGIVLSATCFFDHLPDECMIAAKSALDKIRS